MRTILLPLVLLPAFLAAQTTFAPLGAKWTYLERFAFSSDSAIFQIESIGDTVILGHTSQVLEYTGIIGCISEYRYVRTSNDTVYFWEPVTGSFQILFVADAAIGELWNTTVSSIPFEVSEMRTGTVTGTSTVTISGLPLRRIVVSYGSGSMFDVNPGPYLTERLGAAYGLFPWRMSFCDGAYIEALRCYEDNEISWVNPQFMQCELSTGMTEHSNASMLRVQPTLIDAGGTINISSPRGAASSVFDATGRMIRQVQGNESMVIGTPGMYFVRIALGDERSQCIKVLVR